MNIAKWKASDSRIAQGGLSRQRSGEATIRGLRYLKQGEVKLVMEVGRERARIVLICT